MRKVKRKKGNKKLVLLMVLVLLVGIGFAALQSNLRINGNATIESYFSVGIIKIEKAESTGLAFEKKAPAFTPTTASFDVGLKLPGDTVVYNVTVQNDGEFNAKLESLMLDQNGNSNIKYEILGIEEGYLLTAFSSHTFQVKVSYVESDAVNEAAYKEATITMLFVQTNENSAAQDEAIALFEQAKPNWYGTNVNYYHSADNNGVTITNAAGSEYLGDGSANIYDSKDNSLVMSDEDGATLNLNYNQEYSFYAVMNSVINGKKVYTQKSDVANFYLVLEPTGFIRNYKTSGQTAYDVIAYSNDATNGVVTLPSGDNVGEFAPALFQKNESLHTIIIPADFDTSKLSNMFFYSTTKKLTKIVNKTGQSINWGPLFGEGVGDCTLETGVCTVYDWEVTITDVE